MQTRVKRVLRPGTQAVGAVWYYARGIYRDVDENPIYLLAAGIAYNLLLCAVPVFFLLMYALGQLIAWQAVMAVVETQLRAIIPDPSTRTSIMNVLSGQVDVILHSSRLAGAIGIIGAVWTGTALFSSARTAINGIYKARPVRFFALYKLQDLTLLLMLGALVLIANFAGLVAAVVHEIGRQFIPVAVETIAEDLASRTVAFAAMFVLFVLLYRFLAHRHVPWSSALVGAATASLLWEIARWGFMQYVAYAPTLGILYGAYSFVVVAALWLYYASLVFIIGGILTKLHWERRVAMGRAVD